MLDWKGAAMIYIKQLLQEYRNEKAKVVKKAAILRFSGVGDQDVYNITAPLNWRGKK